MGDLILFFASAAYFWQMMFKRHPRLSGIFAGALFVAMAGIIFQNSHQEIYRNIAALVMSAILIRRTILTLMSRNR